MVAGLDLGKVRGWLGLRPREPEPQMANDKLQMANAGPASSERRGRRHPEDGMPGVVGWVGRRSGFGVGLEDPDPALSGRHGLEKADQMRRTDGQVRAIQAVIGLPIRSTHWYVEPPKGASPAECEAVELLDADLM